MPVFWFQFQEQFVPEVQHMGVYFFCDLFG